jgi:predicted TIM-barrel fold metal-dependent hydrolase
MNRRKWIAGSAMSVLGVQASLEAQNAGSAANNQATPNLSLTDYAPKSMLRTAETKTPRARFPVIDFHTHITFAGRGENALRFGLEPEFCLQVMDRKNLRTMVDLTGGHGQALRTALRRLPEAHAGRFIVFTEPAWDRASEPKYSKYQADLVEDAHRAGAKGLKVLKTPGLSLRETGTNKLVRVDDRRFDPMWEAVGSLKMPVAIHTSDPRAFFLPIDRFNERWEELHAHPDWSFYGKDFPSDRELQEARRNVMRRHPHTNFVCLHVACSEDLAYVSECLDAHPNMYVDIAARIGELGRQPRASRRFFDKYQDRIVFGTDASGGTATPQQTFGDAMYEIYWRFLETEDEYFDYAPAATPPQGRWRISGIGLPESILKKVYSGNAARLLGIAV